MTFSADRDIALAVSLVRDTKERGKRRHGKAGLGLILAMAIQGIACGGGGGNSMGVCVPGASVACSCTSGSQGAQTCSSDGSGYGACNCSGNPGSAGATGTGGSGSGGATGNAGRGGTSGAGVAGGSGAAGNLAGGGGAGMGGAAGLAGSGATGGSSGGAVGTGRGGAAGGGTGGSGGMPPTSWTILVYGHGDNSLSRSLLKDLSEMHNAQIGQSLHLIVLADWDATQTLPDTTTNFPSGSFWYRVPGNGAQLTLVESGPELNLDDPAVLSSAISKAFTTWPATRYGLVLWDHGGSWQGGFGGDTQDHTIQGTGMSISQVATGVRNGTTAAGLPAARPLDFFGFDTCLMAGAEVASSIGALAKVLIANAEIDYGAGWDYTATLTWLNSHIDVSAREFAAAEVAAWDAHHASSTEDDKVLRSHVAIDLQSYGAFGHHFGDVVVHRS